MKKLIFVSLSTFSLLISLQNNVFACGCAGRVADLTEAVTTDFNRASVVFSGKVTATEFVAVKKEDSASHGKSDAKTLIIRFAVDSWWKGKSQDEFILDTSNYVYPSEGIGVGTGCEYGFIVGKKYLVYADSSKGKTIAHDCSGTAPLEYGEKDIPLLDKLKEQNKPDDSKNDKVALIK